MVEAIKSGAHDYIRKPFDRHATVARVHDAIEAWSCRDRITNALAIPPAETDQWNHLSTKDRDTLALMRLLKVVCK
jgi:FixJ family two-component response regulator